MCQLVLLCHSDSSPWPPFLFLALTGQVSAIHLLHCCPLLELGGKFQLVKGVGWITTAPEAHLSSVKNTEPTADLLPNKLQHGGEPPGYPRERTRFSIETQLLAKGRRGWGPEWRAVEPKGGREA